VFVLDHIAIMAAVNLIRHLHWATGDCHENILIIGQPPFSVYCPQSLIGRCP
jgi:hypothetical protein